jgi:hypothetical protein
MYIQIDDLHYNNSDKGTMKIDESNMEELTEMEMSRVVGGVGVDVTSEEIKLYRAPGRGNLNLTVNSDGYIPGL